MKLKGILKKPAKKETEKKEQNQTHPNPPLKKGGSENRDFSSGTVGVKDVIAPSALEVDFNFIRIENKYYRTLFIAGYPRFVGMNWLSPLINFDASLTVSMYVYPSDGKEVLDDLRRKIAEMEAEINTDVQRGRVVNPSTQAKLEDALNLQQDLVKGEERFFQFGLYLTISAESEKELNSINKNLEAALGSLMIISKKATLQMEDGFKTTLPICKDKLSITRNMDTTSLATTFPFVSSDLSDDKGIMFGINRHNGSLVIFDRFSMENYNSVVFATAGAGKSYMIKLEVMRSLMMGTDIIVIDPENEYKNLCEAVGGQYIAFGYNEVSKINPFDLPVTGVEEGENALNNKILALHKLFNVMLGKMDAVEESILDKALVDSYKAKGITPDPETQKKDAPLLEDLYKALLGMEEEKAKSLAARMEKYVKGSFAGIFNQKTTVDLKNKFVVFGVRNLEESLRPMAMHIILDYIWTVIRGELKKRILVVDEAWNLMQNDDSGSFLRGIVKRGRKYYLGVTTITQDVDDFLATPYGKEIVTNSAIQILLKQHSAAIDQVGEVFYLSEGEKQLLLTADQGEGIFFAGQNHVAIKVIASEDEHKLITSNPEDVVKMKTEGKVPKPEVMTATKDEVIPMSQEEATQPAPASDDKPRNETTKVVSNVAGVAGVARPTPAPRNEPANASSNVARPAPAPASDNKSEPRKEAEVNLENRIKELEKVENAKIEKAKENKTDSNEQANSKQLYKAEPATSQKLPPLPKIPPSGLVQQNKPTNLMSKAPSGTGTTSSYQTNIKKPVFTQDKKIPQPAQLAGKQKPVFKADEAKVKEVKAKQKPDSNGMDAVKKINEEKETDKKPGGYDDLFGDNSIV